MHSMHRQTNIWAMTSSSIIIFQPITGQSTDLSTWMHVFILQWEALASFHINLNELGCFSTWIIPKKLWEVFHGGLLFKSVMLYWYSCWPVHKGGSTKLQTTSLTTRLSSSITISRNFSGNAIWFSPLQRSVLKLLYCNPSGGKTDLELLHLELYSKVFCYFFTLVSHLK